MNRTINKIPLIEGQLFAEWEKIMSVQLAKLLLSLSDPINYAAYEENPNSVVDRFKLTDGDRAALRSGGSGWIRAQAKLADDITGLSGEHPAVIDASQAVELEVMVEIHAEAHDMIAENEPDAILEAENGQLYRILA
jgi:hypothetical protein